MAHHNQIKNDWRLGRWELNPDLSITSLNTQHLYDSWWSYTYGHAAVTFQDQAP